ncbi:unnamed protein product [Strongylus vulgaris]|uniref:Amidohydrolase-related domain-containing protein n=1 Tax=Strongylus vulgaris TaxID=40348 RepID=A0A3P7LVJ9_STRVU|nr:unnamed protein product [Strongylus vulgaris]
MANFHNLLEHNSKTVTIAVAAHSARAVSFENIKKLYEMAIEKGIAFHIHVEEQPKEIEDCMRFLGERRKSQSYKTDMSAKSQSYKTDMSAGPSDVLLENLNITKLFSGVHVTYTPVENIREITKLGGNTVICPCTEGYLGDGIPQVIDGQHISYGTDCNNRIGFLEEMRWACYSQQVSSICPLCLQKLRKEENYANICASY